MINELVEIIKESLPFIVLVKLRHFVEKYETVALLYDLPSLVIVLLFTKHYIYFLFEVINL